MQTTSAEHPLGSAAARVRITSEEFESEPGDVADLLP